MDTVTPSLKLPGITLTAMAASQISKLIQAEGASATMLRLSVMGGGCAGFFLSVQLRLGTECRRPCFRTRRRQDHRR